MEEFVVGKEDGVTQQSRSPERKHTNTMINERRALNTDHDSEPTSPKRRNWRAPHVHRTEPNHCRLLLPSSYNNLNLSDYGLILRGCTFFYLNQD